jgi:hypothetical protein
MNVISKSILLKVVFLFCSVNLTGQLLAIIKSKTKVKNSLIIIILFNLIQTLAFGQNNMYLKIDSLILSEMKDNRIIGLSIGIMKDGELFYKNGYGFTSIDSMYKVTENTVFSHSIHNKSIYCISDNAICGTW